MDLAEELRRTVEAAHARLRAVPGDVAARSGKDGAWSPVQVIGHLVDSASNNHQRFVRARFRPDLRFEGYDQDAWVSAQGYAAAPWQGLLDLWRAFNLHLARVIETTPDEALRVPRADHNLDAIAWRTLPTDRPATLEYFMRDYLGHLQHHLRQIDAALGGAGGKEAAEEGEASASGGAATPEAAGGGAAHAQDASTRADPGPHTRSWTTEVAVRSYELDSFAHANHAVFLNYLEYARFDALEQAGFAYADLRARGWGVYVVRVEVDYLKEARLGDRLRIRTRGESPRRSSMVFAQDIAPVEAPDSPAVRARITAVWVGEDGRPMRIPDPVARLFDGG